MLHIFKLSGSSNYRGEKKNKSILNFFNEINSSKIPFYAVKTYPDLQKPILQSK